MNIATTHNTRTTAVSHEVARRLVRDAQQTVRSAIIDAGGTWTPDLREVTFWAATLRTEREFAAIIAWHAGEATTPDRWPLGAHDADGRLAIAANRVLRKVGSRMRDFVTTTALDAVYTSLGEDDPVVANIRVRDARFSDNCEGEEGTAWI